MVLFATTIPTRRIVVVMEVTSISPSPATEYLGQNAVPLISVRLRPTLISESLDGEAAACPLIVMTTAQHDRIGKVEMRGTGELGPGFHGATQDSKSSKGRNKRDDALMLHVNLSVRVQWRLGCVRSHIPAIMSPR